MLCTKLHGCVSGVYHGAMLLNQIPDFLFNFQINRSENCKSTLLK